MAEEAKVVEASDEIKFSEEELKELGELQQSYQEKQAQLGIDQKLLTQNEKKMTAEEKSAALKYDIKKNNERNP